MGRRKQRATQSNNQVGPFPAELASMEVQEKGTHGTQHAVKTKPNVRSCTTCGATSTPQWREGPLGPKTLCNACGVRHLRALKKGASSASQEQQDTLPLSTRSATKKLNNARQDSPSSQPANSDQPSTGWYAHGAPSAAIGLDHFPDGVGSGQPSYDGYVEHGASPEHNTSWNQSSEADEDAAQQLLDFAEKAASYPGSEEEDQHVNQQARPTQRRSSRPHAVQRLDPNFEYEQQPTSSIRERRQLYNSNAMQTAPVPRKRAQTYQYYEQDAWDAPDVSQQPLFPDNVVADTNMQGPVEHVQIQAASKRPRIGKFTASTLAQMHDQQATANVVGQQASMETEHGGPSAVQQGCCAARAPPTAPDMLSSVLSIIDLQQLNMLSWLASSSLAPQEQERMTALQQALSDACAQLIHAEQQKAAAYEELVRKQAEAEIARLELHQQLGLLVSQASSDRQAGSYVQQVDSALNGLPPAITHAVSLMQQSVPVLPLFKSQLAERQQ